MSPVGTLSICEFTAGGSFYRGKGSTVMNATFAKELASTPRTISVRVDVTVLVHESESETDLEAVVTSIAKLPRVVANRLIAGMLTELPQQLSKSALKNLGSYKIPVLNARAEPLAAEVPELVATM